MFQLDEFIGPKLDASDCINIKILNAGAWSRSSDKVAVTLPPELEDYIPEVEKFYKNEHSGRKLTWHHLMSNGVVSSVSFLRRTIRAGIVEWSMGHFRSTSTPSQANSSWR